MEGEVERINNGDESRANKHIILITLDLWTTLTHNPAILSVCVCVLQSEDVYADVSTCVYLYIIHQNFQLNSGLSLSYIVHTKDMFTGCTVRVKQGQFGTNCANSIAAVRGSVFETPPGKW